MKASPSEGSPDVAPEHYYSRAYNTKERVCSFWHQVDEVLEMGAQKVLEVGPGSGFVTHWLREAGVEVVTLDMDAALEPDVAASVTDIPLPDGSVDVTMACQVLEHLPFDQAELALAELGRVARLGVIVSLPDARPWVGKAYPLYYGLYANLIRSRIPKGWVLVLRGLRAREFRIRDYVFARLVPASWGYGDRITEMRRPPIPHGPMRAEDFEGGEAHCYEIGMEGYPLERVAGAFAKAGLALAKDYRVPENPWHHFFVAKL